MNYITLGDLLAIVETGSEFIRLTRADKFSAMLSDLDDASSYYSWAVTGIDIGYTAGAILIMSIMEAETAATYFHPDNSRLTPAGE